MSATNRGGQREKNDFYPTPDWLTKAVLPHILPTKFWYMENRRAFCILEPAAGDGAIIRSIIDFCKENTEYRIPQRIDKIDIDPQDSIKSSCRKADFLSLEPNPIYDLVITNPPFSLCKEFIECSLRWTRNIDSKVVKLFRNNFLASQGRVEFFDKYWPKEMYISARRPIFVKGSSDNSEYGWGVFTNEDNQKENGLKYCKSFLLDTRRKR